MAIAPGVVLLDETHKLLRYAVSESVAKDELKMEMLQTTLFTFLKMLKGNFIEKRELEELVPLPSLENLSAKGIPLEEKDKVKMLLT